MFRHRPRSRPVLIGERRGRNNCLPVDLNCSPNYPDFAQACTRFTPPIGDETCPARRAALPGAPAFSNYVPGALIHNSTACSIARDLPSATARGKISVPIRPPLRVK